MPSTAIAVFCYKRPEKLKASMEALLKNPECSSLEIVFFADGYKGENDKAGVLATRAYVDTLTGFKQVHKHFRERNYSTGPNFFDGLTYMSNHYDQFIIVEDDLVVTPNYISYMLQGLDFYRNDKDVFCITSFVFPLKLDGYAYDTVICNRFCSYGWSIWSDRMKGVVFQKDELVQLVNTTPDLKKNLDKEGLDLYRMLKKQISGEISTWDIQMEVHVAKNHLKVVYPIISKSKNIGFDNESTNTFGIDYLQTPQDDGTKRTFRFSEPDKKNLYIQNQIRKPYMFQALATRKVINSLIAVNNSIRQLFKH